MPVQTKTIQQEVLIKTPPHEIYELFMDSKKHSKLIDGKAQISREIGGSFSVFEGSINGTNLDLEQDKKIVQKWRSEEEDWPSKHYSILTLLFEPIKEGTLVKLTHAKVPSTAYESVKDSWNTYYWEPLKIRFEK